MALDSLNTQTIAQKDSVINELKILYGQKTEIEILLKDQLTTQKSIIELQDKKFNDIKDSYKAENLQLKKDLRKQNIKSSLVQSAVIVSLILLPVLLIK